MNTTITIQTSAPTIQKNSISYVYHQGLRHNMNIYHDIELTVTFARQTYTYILFTVSLNLSWMYTTTSSCLLGYKWVGINSRPGDQGPLDS